jgi:uncharacterized protein YndB with AHSA1/START domain
MSRNRLHVDAPPAQVFAVLTDARSYADWVVGAKEIRAVDPDWPKPGSAFHHSVGVGATVDDATRVLELEPGRRLALRVKARPFSTGTVDFELEPDDGGTTVTMSETVDGWAWVVLRPVVEVVLHVRNTETLRRLRREVERRQR